MCFCTYLYHREIQGDAGRCREMHLGVLGERHRGEGAVHQVHAQKVLLRVRVRVRGRGEGSGSG